MDMRTFKHISAVLLACAAVVGLCLSVGSCRQDLLVDTSEFTLYYPGITDVASKTIIYVDPSSHGQKASDFRITRVTLEGYTYKMTDEFAMDSQSGRFSITGGEAVPAGTYRISVSCVSGGKTFEFPDAIEVNIMEPAPDGIYAEPELVSVDLSLVRTEGNDLTAYTSQIGTKGNHISISDYIISAVYRDGTRVPDVEADKLFSVSGTGKVSILCSSSFKPGRYTIDFQLLTSEIGMDDKEGLAKGIVTFDVTSEPKLFEYNPAAEEIEVNQSDADFLAEPQLVGSQSEEDEVEYAISRVVKNGADVDLADIPFIIDFRSGKLSVKAGTFVENDEFRISVSVRNRYSEGGNPTGFDDVFSVKVVRSLDAIGDFSYDSEMTWQEVAFENSPKSLSGSNVVYSFGDISDALAENITIDASNGTVSAVKGHSIPVGRYAVKVCARNMKGSKEAMFELNVEKNPNYFTRVHWGNNIGLEPFSEYANQFRSKGSTVTQSVTESDIPLGATAVRYEYVSKGGSFKPSIAADGTLTISSISGNTLAHWGLINVTVGDDERAITRSFPVFFMNDNKELTYNKETYTIEYTPFVLMCNPKKGITSEAPKINGTVGVPEGFVADARRDFQFWNLDGPSSHVSGKFNETAQPYPFLREVWTNYAGVFLANKNPMSLYAGGNDKPSKVGYMDNDDDLRITINPGIFRNRDGYANGVYTWQATFTTDGKAVNDGTGFFPVFVWFDDKF